MLEKGIVDKALKFYNLDDRYKNICYQVVDEINSDINLYENFVKAYNKLYNEEFDEVKKMWNIKHLVDFFPLLVNPFITNLLILCGYSIHKNTMEKLNFSNNQIMIQKYRVKECFESDLINRGYNGVRLSQLLWAVYFIRGRIIETGSLQYEYEDKNNIKIHIPKKTNLDILKVRESINNSKMEISSVFKVTNYNYKCNSWLLSRRLNDIINEDSNISKFYNLFDVIDGQDCINDILNFVYGLEKCDDYSKLVEDTTLQKQIKKALLNNEKFYLGIGVLKEK